MYKEDLIKHLAKTYRRPRRHYEEALSEIFTVIKEKMADGKPIHLTGFGTFYTRLHKGGTGKNFKTGQKLTYKEVRQAAFRPGVLLRQAVRRKKKGFFSR